MPNDLPPASEAKRIRFDFNNMIAEQVVGGGGVTMEAIAALGHRAARAHEELQRLRKEGKLEWADLPYRGDVAAEVTGYAASVRDDYENVVVLGIGGSALGPAAIHMALSHPYYDILPPEQRGPRLFFLDNVDPVLNAGLLDTVDLSRTLFNVISKSGSTVETMAQFVIFGAELRRRLGDAYRKHIVVTTDPRSGLLRELAASEGFRAFAVPSGVGGRFSVLSPVGLLAAAVAGIDVEELLAGAAYADKISSVPDIWRNPAYMNALLQYIAATMLGRHIVVMMPYAQSLLGVADWFRQLWAESLGKRHDRDGREVRVGPTPVKALGVTDQHSQVQLYAEGPRDKVINFLAVERFPCDLTIPDSDVQGLAYLSGHTLGELMQAERRATELALTSAGQANCTLILPEISAFAVGQLLFLLEIQTAYSGELYNINAFDQPGVEAGKVATFALLGRKGYEQQRADIEGSYSRRKAAYII